MTESDGWSITGITSEGSSVSLDKIPLDGFSWPAGQWMQINGTNFYVDPTGGPNPVVTVGSDTVSPDATNVCGLDLKKSTSTSLIVVHVPETPSKVPGPQTLYVKNFPGGPGPGSTISQTNALTYVMPATSKAPKIPIIFKNNSGVADDQVWVQFLNGTFGGGQKGAGGTVALSGNTGYSLERLTSKVPKFENLGSVPNVSLNDFANGRIYLNFGKKALGVPPGTQPDPTKKTAPNYDTRYAYIELNVFGNSQNNMDISNIDFFSFTIEASTWKNGAEVNELTSKDTSTLRTAIEAVLLPTAIVIDSCQNVVRILGPGLAAAGYHDWTVYMTFLENKTTTIAGVYAGTSTQPRQSYNLTASFDATTQMVTLSGTTQDAPLGKPLGSKVPTIIEITYAEMNAMTGVYGANPSYSVNSAPVAPLANDVYGWIVGDLLAGMNWGFPGSPTPVPGQPEKTMGDLTSSEWFAVAKTNPSVQFGGAQSNGNYYNQYAAANQPLTMAYGFPFTDRLGGVLLYFPPSVDTNGVDYLKITIC